MDSMAISSYRQTYSEHKVFRLGDFVNSSDEQFFEKVEKAGYVVGAISPMNASNKLKNLLTLFLIHGHKPHLTKSFMSRSITSAIVQAVNDNSNQNLH